MNFGILKNTVQTLIQGYNCPFCKNTSIAEQNIDIVGAAGNTMNIDLHCPKCNRHFMAKTEIMQMDLGKLSVDKLGKIQESLSALKGKLGGDIDIEIENISTGDTEVQAKNAIQDKTIVDLQKGMTKKSFKVDDLFS